MRATCLVCTLKRSPEVSNSESLAQVVLDALRSEGVETDVIRLATTRSTSESCRSRHGWRRVAVDP